MSNRVNLTLDIMKASIKNPLITVRQGEGNFETLRATVTANGEPLDLQGWKITFMGTTAGKHKIVDGNVTIVDASSGIFEYTPSKAWGVDIGGFRIAYFKFVSGDGSTSSANFQVEVIESVDLTQEEAQNYISVVDSTISEIDKRLNDSLANVTRSIAETSSAASSLSVNISSVASSAVNQINDTASSAVYNVDSVASNTVNNVNSTASSAVDNVNKTASNAVNNVNVTASNATDSITSSVTTLGNRVDEYNNKLADIQVGGRNLYLNSKSELMPSGYGIINAQTVTVEPFDSTTNMLHIVSAQGRGKSVGVYLYDYANGKIPNKSDWSYSADMKGTGKIVKFGIEDSIRYAIKGAVGNNWSRVSQTGHVNEPQYKTVLMYFDTTDSPLDVYIKLPKLEIGNVPTDWTPAPEDAPSNDAQLVHKTGTETIAGDKTVTGNTIMSTTTILSGNYGLRVTASGIQKTTDGKTWVSANI